MARREYALRFVCTHPECNETVRFHYATMRERADSYEARVYGGDAGWKCVRHSNPDRVLSESNPETHFEVVSTQETYGVFFGNQGLVTGPGFLAYAKDFPAGTKLIVTARIVTPDTPIGGEAKGGRE